MKRTITETSHENTEHTYYAPKDGQLIVILLTQTPNRIKSLLVFFIPAMREVKPTNIHATEYHLFKHGLIGRRWTDGTNNFSIPCRRLGCEIASGERCKEIGFDEGSRPRADAEHDVGLVVACGGWYLFLLFMRDQ